MRNPMQTIVSMTDILTSTTMTTIQSDAVAAIFESVTLMRRLANDVLDLSKMEAGKLQIETVSFDLKHCIKGVTAGFTSEAPRKGIDFDIRLSFDLPDRIISDPTRLHQIIINL